MMVPPKDPKPLVSHQAGSNLVNSELEHLLQETLVFMFAQCVQDKPLPSSHL